MSKKRHSKIKKYLLVFFCIILSLIIILWGADFLFSSRSSQLQYGVTFSAPYARSLGLDSDEVYRSIIDGLKVKKIRIPVYWNLVEENEGKFDFKAIDRLFDLSSGKNIQIILAVGYKLPRWPECFQPSWAISLGRQERQKKILTLINQVVDHFKEREEIIAWQVENEPFLDFGLCEKLDSGFLEKEITAVKSKDTRPIILTDSGELGWWIPTMISSDIMGTTLYRTVWNPIFGFFDYPIPPLLYNLKATLLKNIFSRNSQKVIISELQAEPWPPGNSIQSLTLAEQAKIFNIKQFKEVADYAARTGISEQYLWGVEWWYFMKKQGQPQYWDFAKTLF